MRAKILVLNGSLGGDSGNTAELLRALYPHLSAHEVETISLRDDLWGSRCQDSVQLSGPASGPASGPRDGITQKLREADGFVFATDTYWDSWGSPLQNFLEKTTELEATDIWLGKPALCLVTMHSVGGKEVLSRLQGVLSTLGMVIPPMGGMAHSMTGHVMLQSPQRDPSFDQDIWSLSDLEMMSRNFLTMLELRHAPNFKFESWPVDARDPARIWLRPEPRGRLNPELMLSSKATSRLGPAPTASLHVRAFDLSSTPHPRGLEPAIWENVAPTIWQNELFAHTPLDLEIGCGVGWHPIQYTTRNPDRRLIAIEHTSAKFERFTQRLQHHPHLMNLLAVHADAVSWVSHLLPDQSLSRIMILYPNPEPKSANKRWMRSPFMHLLLKKLISGGELILATNEIAYFEEALRYGRDFWKLNVALEQRFTQESMPMPSPRSHFEKKYLARGQTCLDVTFTKP